MSKVSITVLALLLALSVAADDGSEEDQEPSIEDIAAATERVTATFDALIAHVDAASAQFYAECLRVIPSRSLCSCLSKETPLDVSFETYVSWTYQEGEIVENIDDYSQDDQGMFRATMQARDKCSE